jgi:hypothetical protein
MTRFAWLQFRTRAVLALVALAVVAIVLGVTGPHVHDLYSSCKAQGDCGPTTVLGGPLGPLQMGLDATLLVGPVLIGMFWGAPLVASELEAGTLRLAWAQSVTRGRWLAAKLGVVGLSSMAVAGLFSLMATWWFSPIDATNGGPFPLIPLRGIAPVGYTAFALVLGVTAGALLRRVLPAMASTLVAFIACRLAVTYWLRPHFMGAVRAVLAYGALGGEDTLQGGSSMVRVTGAAGAWVYSGYLTFPRGTQRACAQDLTDACLARAREVLVYQPAGRYWIFQSCETVTFLAIAAVLAGACFWWAEHRLS